MLALKGYARMYMFVKIEYKVTQMNRKTDLTMPLLAVLLIGMFITSYYIGILHFL